MASCGAFDYCIRSIWLQSEFSSALRCFCFVEHGSGWHSNGHGKWKYMDASAVFDTDVAFVYGRILWQCRTTELHTGNTPMAGA